MAGIFLFFGRSEALHLRRYWPGQPARDVREALARIPPLAHVSAQAAIAPHLANRKWLFIFPETGSADYVIVDPRLDRWPVVEKRFEEAVRKVEEKGFQLIFQRNGVRLYRRSKTAGSLDRNFPFQPATALFQPPFRVKAIRPHSEALSTDFREPQTGPEHHLPR